MPASVDPPVSGAAPERRGPQGTQIFSSDELDRILAAAAVSAPNDATASLRGASESVAGRAFPLQGERVVVGRADSCDLIINEPSISSEHARFTRDGDDWRVANLLSTNGTFVNGKRASSATLRHGDRVRIGRIEFIFELPHRRRATGGAQQGGRRRLLLLAGAGIVVLAALAGAAWTLGLLPG